MADGPRTQGTIQGGGTEYRETQSPKNHPASVPAILLIKYDFEQVISSLSASIFSFRLGMAIVPTSEKFNKSYIPNKC